MSKDYNVFLKYPENIKASDFESFAYKQGYFIRVFPSGNYTAHSGFLPFNLYLNFIDRILPYDSFVSGFETYFSDYRSQDYDGEFNSLVNNPKSVMLMCISDMDSLEELSALIWAEYLCEYCGGVLYDPQTDTLYSDPSVIDALIYRQKEELIRLSAQNALKLHEFTGWR